MKQAVDVSYLFASSTIDENVNKIVMESVCKQTVWFISFLQRSHGY